MMNNLKQKNPFEFEKANSLTKEEIAKYFVDDHNFSRFIKSSRNIFLEGERGAGKTMALLFNSFPVQASKYLNSGLPIDRSSIGIHIPCNTPLFHKREHLLLRDRFHQTITTEHFLVLNIANAICKSLLESNDKELLDEISKQSDKIRFELGYVLSAEIPQGEILHSIQMFLQRESSRGQNLMNKIDIENFVINAYSFASLVIPILNIFTELPLLSNSHFLLMVDDAHDLDKLQIKTLNSWIAFRDNSKFSFKVATTKSNRPLYITSSGGSIISGHDFIVIDLERPYQNSTSDFGKMAKKIIERRLEAYGITDISAEDFFPAQPEFLEDLEWQKEVTRKEANKKYPEGPPKKISDFIYKYSRVGYFRSRPAKANMPPYSGFETIVSLSTGIVRHLLEPCYWMFDTTISETELGEDIKQIPPNVQSKTIAMLSNRLWDRIMNGLDQEVEGCTREQAKQIHNLFEQLFVLFRNRLLFHDSEPRAIAFTVSEKSSRENELLDSLLQIAIKSLLLYKRIAKSKDDGIQEFYYSVNRMLIPKHHLDPVGQHSRISLKATDLWNAAENNKSLPFSKKDDPSQPTLFDEI